VRPPNLRRTIPSGLNSQPPWLANGLEMLSRRKHGFLTLTHNTSKKSRLYHPLFPFTRDSESPMTALMERKVFEGEVLHSNNLETSLGRLNVCILCAFASKHNVCKLVPTPEMHLQIYGTPKKSLRNIKSRYYDLDRKENVHLQHTHPH
jgi:hypothetical protein